MGFAPIFPTGNTTANPSRRSASSTTIYVADITPFKVGVAKTHELWATFFAGKPDAARLKDFFRAADLPLLAQCTPSYVSGTLALGAFPPADPAKYCGYDAWMQTFFEAHLADRDRVREFGFLNYGDWYNTAWPEWGNLEYDTARIWFLQYLRTGDRRVLRPRGTGRALSHRRGCMSCRQPGGASVWGITQHASGSDLGPQRRPYGWLLWPVR